MSGIDGYGSGMNDFYSSFFGTSSTAGGSSFFGGTSMLGDYSMIQSGAYKKLLTAYYKSEKASESGEDNAAAGELENETTGKLLNVKSDAESLQGALNALNDASLYDASAVDKEGNKVDHTEDIKKKVTAFVEAYNSYLDTAGDVDATKLLKKTLNMVGFTSANAGLLKEVGITIGKDNKLSVDEEKLKEAKLTTLDTLFHGRGSFGARMSDKAQEVYKMANGAAYSNNRASTYTYNGTYSILGTSNGSLDKYL